MNIPPTHPGVNIQELPGGVHPIAGVATNITAFVGQTLSGPINEPTRILSFSDFESLFGVGGPAAESATSYSIWQYFLNGGTEAWVVRVVDGTCEEQLTAGIQSLDAADIFNLLVLPGVSMPAVVTAAVAYCEKRRAFLILDAPASANTPAQIAQAVEGGAIPRTSYAAVYYPWVAISDPLNIAQTRLAPPSGTVAGVFAATDASRGVWKAPAGTGAGMQGVQGLEYSLSDAEDGTLNSIAVNCLRNFPIYGNVVLGARTLEGADQLASEWKYIPVRRLALFIEESLYRGIQWAVFEPNNEMLWAEIRLNVATFMENLFRQGAFQGESPQSAYFVKCDSNTTTQADIDQGIVNIVVGFAPLNPGEFVVIQLQQLAGQTAA